MKPVSPIVPGMDLPETVYAKDQKPYIPLPVYRYGDGTVLSRWKLTLKERLIVLLRGDVFLYVSTFGSDLQPVKLQIERPEAEKPRPQLVVDTFTKTWQKAWRNR